MRSLLVKTSKNRSLLFADHISGRGVIHKTHAAGECCYVAIVACPTKAPPYFAWKRSPKTRIATRKQVVRIKTDANPMPKLWRQAPLRPKAWRE